MLLLRDNLAVIHRLIQPVLALSISTYPCNGFMQINLIPHPTTPNLAIRTLSAEVQTSHHGNLILRYTLHADLAQLLIPPPQVTKTVDGLWQHTCFEAFFAIQGEKAYREFNFSPSSEWAAYAFSDYRVRTDWQMQQAPVIECETASGQLMVKVTLATEHLPKGQIDQALLIGLTAVVEAKDGDKSYWAIQHPTDKPDFHHRDGFIKLPALPFAVS